MNGGLSMEADPESTFPRVFMDVDGKKEYQNFDRKSPFADQFHQLENERMDELTKKFDVNFTYEGQSLSKEKRGLFGFTSTTALHPIQPSLNDLSGIERALSVSVPSLAGRPRLQFTFLSMSTNEGQPEHNGLFSRFGG